MKVERRIRRGSPARKSSNNFLKFGTSPVRSSYWGFMSVDMQQDLEAVSSFINAANYPNPMNALEAELNNALAQDKSPVIGLELLAAA